MLTVGEILPLQASCLKINQKNKNLTAENLLSKVAQWIFVR
jgi:hypothetical protein